MRYLLLCIVVSTGCEPPCEDPCADLPPAREVVGTAADFTLGPQSRDGMTISAPYACTYSGHGDAVRVERDGDVALPDGFVADTVALLVADGIEVVYSGVGFCTETPAPWISIDDWTRADDAVRIVGKAMRDRDYGGAVELRVEQELIACAQIACGF